MTVRDRRCRQSEKVEHSLRQGKSNPIRQTNPPAHRPPTHDMAEHETVADEDINSSTREYTIGPATDHTTARLTQLIPSPTALSALSDIQILALTQQIKDTSSLSKPLVSSFEPLTALKSDFENNPIPLLKLSQLEDLGYHRAEIRGDGNCFYRAFGFGLIVGLIETRNEGVVDEILTMVDERLIPLLYMAGMEELVRNEAIAAATSECK